MSKQPEALRLADALDRLIVDALLSQDGNTAKTSAELRRLHALCDESRNVVRGLLNAIPSATTHPAIIAARALMGKLENE